MTLRSDVESVSRFLSVCSWPRLYYGVVPFLAQDITVRNIVEIGVAFGYHAESILGALPDATYHGVDPYRADYDKNDPHSAAVCEILGDDDTQRAMDRLHDVVQERLTAYGGRARLYRQPSLEAASGFNDGFFDFIFVDGNHAYEAVAADLPAWWPKLRSGGILSGDDYLLAGVRRAVDEFTARERHKPQFAAKAGTDYPIWYVAKP